jgi:hypothetical protein
MHVHDMRLLRVRNIAATFEESTTSVVSCSFRIESLVPTSADHRRKLTQEYTHYTVLRRELRMGSDVLVRLRAKMVISSPSKATTDGCRRVEHY